MHTITLTRPPEYRGRMNTWAGVVVAAVVVFGTSLGTAVGYTGLGVIIPAMLLTLWLLPWVVAVARGSMLDVPVLLVTLLLGWTGIGWVVALVMAVLPHREIPVPPYEVVS